MNIFIVLMVIYIAAMLLLGYLGSKRATDSTSYATSNGDVSVFNVSVTFAATFASAGTFLGVAGQGFAYGLTNFWFWASQWTSAGIIMAIIVRRYRRMHSMKKSATVADWIADRYHSQGLRVWLAIVSLAQVAFIASQLVGAGIIINQMIPSISYKMGVLISAIVIIIYICMGGSYAHIYTNIAQGLMMTVLGVILAVSGIFIFGNVITEVPARLAEIDPNLAMGLNPNNAGYPTPIYVVGLFVAHLWWALNPQLINKATYLKNDKDVKTFCWLAPLLMFLMCSVVFVGSYTRVLVPEGIGDVITGMDGAVPYYVSLVFPKFIAAVFLVVIMAAMMSTVDGVLLYVSSILGCTLYKNTIVPARRAKGIQIDDAKVEKTTMNILKYSTFVIGLIAVPIAFNKPANLITGMGDVSVKYGRDGREVQNPTNAGTYTVKIAVIEGTNYATASELTAERWKFTIARNTTEPTVTLSGDTTYTGGQIKPTVTVIVRETTLVVGQDYTVTYGENKNAGENAGSVTVKAMGNYEFTDKTENFSIGKKTLTAADLEFTTGSTFTKVYDGKDTCETVTV